MKKVTAIIVITSVFLLLGLHSGAQQVGSTPEYIKALTGDWEGERLPDGRPYVPDRILERLKNISMEEVWGILRSHGYNNQYQGGWMMINPEYPVMAGRVVTAQYMPLRPDLRDQVRKQGLSEGHSPLKKATYYLQGICGLMLRHTGFWVMMNHWSWRTGHTSIS